MPVPQQGWAGGGRRVSPDRQSWDSWTSRQVRASREIGSESYVSRGPNSEISTAYFFRILLLACPSTKEQMAREVNTLPDTKKFMVRRTVYLLEASKLYSFYTQAFHTSTPKQHTGETESKLQENNLNQKRKKIKNLLSDNLQSLRIHVCLSHCTWHINKL